MNKIPSESFPIEIDVDGNSYAGEVIALRYAARTEKIPNQFSVLLNRKLYFHLESLPEGWRMPEHEFYPRSLVDAVGNFIQQYYE